MKTKLLLFLCLFSGSVMAQDITMTFSSADDAYMLDSITAMNIRTGETITFPGNENLILSSGTGIDIEYLEPFDAMVYPNPNTGQSTIALKVPQHQDIAIDVRNQLGQMVCQHKGFVQAGTNDFSLSLQSSGIYFVSIQHSQGLESIQVVLTKNSSQGNYINYLGSESRVPNPESLKSSSNGNILSYVFGDPVRFFCMSGVHTTIIQDQPREVKAYHYEINFHPCIDPDGMSYPVVEIGEQVWMAENLAFLSSVSPPSAEDNETEHCYIYGYDGTNIEEAKATESCTIYGALYNWEAADKVCPAGWHLSTDEEWKTLEDQLGMSEIELDLQDQFRNSGYIGMKLKSKDIWLDEGEGNDILGLNLLPGGWSGSGIFSEMSTRGSFWTSNEIDDQNALFRSFVSQHDGNWRGAGGKQFGASVRCLKDEGSNNQAPTPVFTISPESGLTTSTFTFDASGCTDDNDASEELLVRWDFNYEKGDGWDTEFSTEKTMSIKYPDISMYQHIYDIRLEVKDSEGASNIATKKLVIDNTGTMTDERDGNTYKTISVGDLTWMAENLAYLPDIFTPIPNQNVDYKAYYVNEYMGDDVEEAKETENYKKYGVLYNWNASESACPDGWHLPGDDEWKNLEAFLGMSEDWLNRTEERTDGNVGMKLKSTEGWLEDGNGTNYVGFNLLPSGLMETGIYKTPGNVFWTWTAIDENSTKWARWTSKTRSGMVRSNATSFSTSVAGSIRCVMDSASGNQPPVASFTISPESGTNQIRYTLDATGSTDDNTALEDLEIRWDFDYEDDPGWDTDFSSEKVMEISFPSYHKTYIIKMEVQDTEGLSNIATGSVLVSNMGSFIDSRDEHEYKTVSIGTQIWMAENLAWLPRVSNSTDESIETPFYYVYGYEGSDVEEAKATDYYNTYGALYNYPAAMVSCPAGWHLPTDEDFQALEEYLGMGMQHLDNMGVRISGNVGKQLKSTEGWNNDGNGINKFGFNILPAGTRMYTGGFGTKGEWVGMWSSTVSPENSNMFMGRGIMDDSDGIQRDDAVRDFGYTVRCIKDN